MLLIVIVRFSMLMLFIKIFCVIGIVLFMEIEVMLLNRLCRLFICVCLSLVLVIYLLVFWLVVLLLLLWVCMIIGFSSMLGWVFCVKVGKGNVVSRIRVGGMWDSVMVDF